MYSSVRDENLPLLRSLIEYQTKTVLDSKHETQGLIALIELDGWQQVQ